MINPLTRNMYLVSLVNDCWTVSRELLLIFCPPWFRNHQANLWLCPIIINLKKISVLLCVTKDKKELMCTCWFITLLLKNCILKGEWGVTASEQEEEMKRMKEFEDSIPKMCSQLRLLTHFYQVFLFKLRTFDMNGLVLSILA